MVSQQVAATGANMSYTTSTVLSMLRVKAKAAITWASVASDVEAEVRVYDRLFSDPNPVGGRKDFIEVLNPNRFKVMTAYVEPSLAAAKSDQKFRFERNGYFGSDRVDHGSGGTMVFNRMTGP